MAGIGLKRFRFFEAEHRQDVALPDNVACSAAEEGTIWLGCSDGMVAGLDAADLSVRCSFQAHKGGVVALACTKVRGVLERGPGARRQQVIRRRSRRPPPPRRASC